MTKELISRMFSGVLIKKDAIINELVRISPAIEAEKKRDLIKAYPKRRQIVIPAV